MQISKFRLVLTITAIGITSVSFSAELGPRPFYLLNDMDKGALRETLAQCSDGPYVRSDFSIGHRGAPLQFPEHTKESYEAAARMGAGILECDVTFTKDRELVCRHSQCDLHTTTNILAIPELARKCSVPFTPATFDNEGTLKTKASAQCCTSDITVAEFKQLTGKMDAANSSAKSVDDYLNGTTNWRTDLYANNGTLMTHADSISLFKSLGARMTPELKSPMVDMPYEGDFTQHDYAQKMINEYKAAGVPPEHVWAQSFKIEDVKYWIKNEPEFGRQSVYLDGRYNTDSFDHTDPTTYEPGMQELADSGIRVLAPPTWMLVDNKHGQMVPSIYAKAATEAGLQLITWTLERSGPLDDGGGWYYQSIQELTNNDGDVFNLLDVLATDVGVIGVFSDWPATVTYYANCKGIALRR